MSGDVTVDEVRAVWETMEGKPTPSRVCRYFAQIGRRVHFNDVRRWSSCDWDVERAKALQRAEQANSKTVAISDLDLEKFSDAQLIREVAREGMISTLQFSREARRRRKELVETPRELGALVQSLSRAGRDYLELYRETILLAERAMKNVEDLPAQQAQEEKPPPVDMLENEIRELHRSMSQQGIKH